MASWELAYMSNWFMLFAGLNLTWGFSHQCWRTLHYF